jgi:hypothetical protein
MKYIQTYGLLLLSLIFFCGSAYFAIPRFLLVKGSNNFVANLSHCLTTGTNDVAAQSACLRHVVVAEVDTDTPENVVNKLRLMDTEGVVGSRCHQIGHYVGISLLAKNGGDIERVLNLCTGLNCGNGCAHGAIVSSFGLLEGGADTQDLPTDTRQLEAIGQPYCARDNPLCHAMGHAFAMSESESANAQRLCDNISTVPVKKIECYMGMFMEYAHTNNSFSNISTPVTPTTYSCDTISGPARYACIRYLSAHVFSQCKSVGNKSATCISKTESACSALDIDDSKACFFGLGYNNNDASMCNRLTSDNAFYCSLGTKFSFKKKHRKEINYCKTLQTPEQARDCTEIYTHMLQGIENTQAED